MPETNWSGYFIYKAEHKDIGSVLKGSFIPVSIFSVKGGTKRVVNLNGTDDLSLVSELEQARSFKNISLFLPPTTNFEWLDLNEISIHRLQFSMSFYVRGEVGKTLTHEFTLSSKNAKIIGLPGKMTEGRKRTVLKVSIELSETKLTHGSPEGGKVVHEDW